MGFLLKVISPGEGMKAGVMLVTVTMVDWLVARVIGEVDVRESPFYWVLLVIVSHRVGHVVVESIPWVRCGAQLVEWLPICLVVSHVAFFVSAPVWLVFGYIGYLFPAGSVLRIAWFAVFGAPLAISLVAIQISYMMLPLGILMAGVFDCGKSPEAVRELHEAFPDQE